MSKSVHWSVMASLALGLCAAPALAQGQHAQAQQALPAQAPQEFPLKDTHKDVKEREVKLNEIPQPVRTAIDGWAHGGKVTKVQQYSAPDGATQYLGTIEQKDGKKLEVLVDPQGKVLRAGKEAQ